MASHLSSTELQRLRRSLERERDALRAAANASDEERRGVPRGEIEEGDLAERIVEQDDAIRLTAFDARRLTEVEHALAKLEAGVYGVSEDSGEPIPFERLEAVPWARRTVEEEERRR